MSANVRFIKVIATINGHDTEMWINADHVVAVLEKTDHALVVTTTGSYRSDAQDCIDILEELDLIVDEKHGTATSGLKAAARVIQPERGRL